MSLLSRLFNVFRRRALERELDDELNFHLEQRTLSNLHGGMNPDEARAAARAQFGDPAEAKWAMREVRMMNGRVVLGFAGGFGTGLAVAGALLLRLHTATPPLQPSVLYADPVYASLAQADTTAPILVEERKPKYTSEALRAKRAGMVLMGCFVQVTGVCTDIRVTRSLDPAGLDVEAIKAAEGWRFRPATRAGQPVPYYVTIEMMFSCKGCTPTEYKPLSINY